MRNTAGGEQIRKLHINEKRKGITVPQTAGINMYYEPGLLEHCCGLPSAWKITTDAAAPCFNQSNLPLGRSLFDAMAHGNLSQSFVRLLGLPDRR